MIKRVTCEVNNFIENGENLIVRNIDNRKKWILLYIDNKTVLVNGYDLKAAIDNCMNTNK